MESELLVESENSWRSKLVRLFHQVRNVSRISHECSIDQGLNQIEERPSIQAVLDVLAECPRDDTLFAEELMMIK